MPKLMGKQYQQKSDGEGKAVDDQTGVMEEESNCIERPDISDCVDEPGISRRQKR